MLVQVKNLIKRYNKVPVLDHLNFEIREGEIFRLLGPNGAGKTTTINILSGLTPYDSGEVRILGKEIKRHEMEVKREIGIVPQEIALFEDLSALENLDYFGRLYGLRGKLLKERKEEALAFTGLTERRSDRPKGFSGGMKRRLNIACAIMHHPKLIIMDEPTVGIDPQSRNHILQSIKKLNEMGSTVIYSSHYMEEIEELCTRIVIVDHGRVIAQGTKDELTSLVSTEEKITVELGSVHYTMVDRIKQIHGVKECFVQGNALEIIGTKGENTMNKVLAALSESRGDIIALQVEQPSLETVFLTLTGRSLRE